MKVLFVVNCNFPYSGTCTNLLSKLLFDGKLLDKIENVDILAGKSKISDASYEQYMGINIYRVASWSVFPKGEIKTAIKKNLFLAAQGILIKTVYWIERKINKKHFIDKYASNAYYNALKKIDAQKYDLIVPVSGRYYHTAAVLKFCKETKTKYIFYQVDPCGTNHGFGISSKQRRVQFEKDLYENASAVITTPIILKEQIDNEFAYEDDNIMGMEFPLISRPDIDINKEKNKAPVCMFIGSIYGGIRNPEYTIRLFKPLIERKEIEFHFVGVKKEELSEEFKELDLHCHGFVKLSVAMELMKKADILVNIGNAVMNQVPSKIFDYISNGKPIVNICKSKECPTLPYLKKYPLALNLFEDESLFDSQMDELRCFVKEKYGEKITFTEVEKIYEECTPKYCAKKMNDIFKKSLYV